MGLATAGQASPDDLTDESWREDERRSVLARFTSAERWAFHRDTGRYWRHLGSIFRSRTFNNLQQPLSLLTLNAATVALYSYSVDAGIAPNYLDDIKFTNTPFDVTSFALSLLLVFRTDASYERWNTGLKAWSDVRSTCNQFMREAVTWVKDATMQQKLVRWTVAYCRCLLLYSRHQTGVTSLADVLYPSELKQLDAAAPYYPQFALQVLTAIIEQARLGEYREDKMLKSMNVFYDAVATCERIMRYPIPLSYTRHTSRFMLLWLLCLPWALYDDCKEAVVPVTAIVSFLLLGIEEIGVQIEEPFSKLPLEGICQDIATDLYNVLQHQAGVERLADPAYEYQLQQEEL